MSVELNTLQSDQYADVLAQQNALLTQIYGPSTDVVDHSQTAGLAIYQNNLLMTAARALSISYPVIEKMVGEQTIVALARHLLQHQQPSSGDWADWGSALATTLDKTPLVEGAPYLPDMATVEWLMHNVARSPTPVLQAETLTLLASHAPDTLYFELPDALTTFHSVIPIDVLWHAHQSQDGEFSLDQEALADALKNASGDCFLVIYQHDLRATIERISEDEFAWLNDIHHGRNLAELLDTHPNFDFAEWLKKASRLSQIKALVTSFGNKANRYIHQTELTQTKMQGDSHD